MSKCRKFLERNMWIINSCLYANISQRMWEDYMSNRTQMHHFPPGMAFVFVFFVNEFVSSSPHVPCSVFISSSGATEGGETCNKDLPSGQSASAHSPFFGERSRDSVTVWHEHEADSAATTLRCIWKLHLSISLYPTVPTFLLQPSAIYFVFFIAFTLGYLCTNCKKKKKHKNRWRKMHLQFY